MLFSLLSPDFYFFAMLLIQDEHKISVAELCTRLETSETKGLTTAKAAEHLAKHGPNRLTPPKQTPEWIKFLSQMVGGFATLLWIGSILCFFAYGIQQSGDSGSSDDNVRFFVLFCFPFF